MSDSRTPEAGPARTAPCLFCDRSQHTILGESASWYIRLDAYRANPGHVEAVTRRHVVSFWDLNGDESAELTGVLAYARNLVEARFGTPDGWTIGINEGRAAGRSIDHLHIHLIPRHDGDVPDPRGGIRQCAPNCDPDAWTETDPAPAPHPMPGSARAEQAEDRLRKATDAYTRLRAQADDAEATRDRWRKRAEEAERERDEALAAVERVREAIEAERAGALEAEAMDGPRPIHDARLNTCAHIEAALRAPTAPTAPEPALDQPKETR